MTVTIAGLKGFPSGIPFALKSQASGFAPTPKVPSGVNGNTRFSPE